MLVPSGGMASAASRLGVRVPCCSGRAVGDAAAGAAGRGAGTQRPVEPQGGGCRRRLAAVRCGHCCGIRRVQLLHASSLWLVRTMTVACRHHDCGLYAASLELVRSMAVARTHHDWGLYAAWRVFVAFRGGPFGHHLEQHGHCSGCTEPLAQSSTARTKGLACFRGPIPQPTSAPDACDPSRRPDWAPCIRMIQLCCTGTTGCFDMQLKRF